MDDSVNKNITDMRQEGNILTPDEGMHLTQKAEVGDSNRVYAAELMLGKADSADNWREASQDEKEAFDARMAEAAEEPDEAAPEEPAPAEVQQQNTD